MDTNAPIAFLPGMGASADFWKPAALLMRSDRAHTFHSWPGLGDEPPSPAVNDPADLVKLVEEGLHEPTDIVAQSMGGVIAIRLALQRPELVRRLVLATTSGGIPMQEHGALDWRISYRSNHPDAPQWHFSDWGDYTDRLHEITVPVLLLWGDNDPISPVKVGLKLKQLLPRADLNIIEGGHHDLARTHARQVSVLIEDFLAAPFSSLT